MKWAAMVAAIQELELNGKSKQVCKFILDSIARFHVSEKAPVNAPVPEFAALKQHQHLQSYFLYMDSAITFAHLLTEQEYTAMLHKAVLESAELLNAWSKRRAQRLSDDAKSSSDCAATRFPLVRRRRLWTRRKWMRRSRSAWSCYNSTRPTRSSMHDHPSCSD